MPGIYTGYLDCNIVGSKNQLLLEEIKMGKIVKREELTALLAEKMAERMKAEWHDKEDDLSSDPVLTSLLALGKKEYTIDDVKRVNGVYNIDKLRLINWHFLTEAEGKEYALICAEALMRYDGLEDASCTNAIIAVRKALAGDASIDLEKARWSILDNCSYEGAGIIADAVYCSDPLAYTRIPERVVDYIAKDLVRRSDAVVPADRKKEIFRGQKGRRMFGRHYDDRINAKFAVTNYLAALLMEVLPE